MNPLKQSSQGHLFVLSGPSGVGKTTLGQALLSEDESLRRSISHTTRKKRPTEICGKDYFFVSAEVFAKKESEGVFIETAEIFGNRYGTSRETIDSLLREGSDVLLIIDWQGARNLKAERDITSIFVLPPSLQSLRTRLVKRQEDTAETVNARMQKALSEMSHCQEYDFAIANVQLEDTVNQIRQIILAVRENRETEGLGLTQAEIETILSDS